MSEDFLFMYNAGENKMYQVNEVICIYSMDMYFSLILVYMSLSYMSELLMLGKRKKTAVCCETFS